MSKFVGRDEQDKRRDKTLKRMLETPPKPHKPTKPAKRQKKDKKIKDD
ncbi:MAG TPA: hypothetical protein VGA60_16270 [Kiloniellales bacterium]|jgi:hypothetical protein